MISRLAVSSARLAQGKAGLVVSLHQGDLAIWQGASALVTSSNESMSGNANPSYWRFAGRANVDGAIRSLSGNVAPPQQALTPGSAIMTRASWRSSTSPTSSAEWIIHTLVPDGAYGTGEKSPSAAEHTLQQCYLSCLALAPGPVIAFPALGCGVREWRTQKAADVGFASLVLFARRQQEQQQVSPLTEVQFVFLDQNVLRVWAAIARKRFGDPLGERNLWDI